jgi:hypothetical protein
MIVIRKRFIKGVPRFQHTGADRSGGKSSVTISNMFWPLIEAYAFGPRRILPIGTHLRHIAEHFVPKLTGQVLGIVIRFTSSNTKPTVNATASIQEPGLRLHRLRVHSNPVFGVPLMFQLCSVPSKLNKLPAIWTFSSAPLCECASKRRLLACESLTRRAVITHSALLLR